MKKWFFVIPLLAFVLARPVFAAEIYSTRGMVSSAHELASQAGIEIMKKGGNAIDAAVATAMALNVVEPTFSGMGGGGFMVIRFAKTGETVVLDYREVAPNSARKDMFASDQAKKEKWSKYGGKSVGVPGWVMGMDTALKKYGTMSWLEVAQPAIRLARQGYTVSKQQHDFMVEYFTPMLEYNDPDSIPYFTKGLPAEEGQTLKLEGLAKAFQEIGEKGIGVFYGGPIGEALVASVNKAGGAMTLQDLKDYKVAVSKPVFGTYRGYQIYSMPPSSSGGTHIIQILNIMENFPVKDWGFQSPRHLHTLGEAMKMAFADREAYMADKAFVKVPLDGLTSKAYAKTLAAKIQPPSVMKEVKAGDPWAFEGKAKAQVVAGPDNHHATSHFSVVDAEGNIVASTNTINYSSGVIVPGYGISLNDEMDDFSSDPKSVNAPEPGKRPLSSMSPTIILDKDGKPFMTVGSAGGWRIITAVSQIIMNVIDFGMGMDEAIEQGRIFTYAMGGKPGAFRIEDTVPATTIEILKLMGHPVEVKPKGDYFGTSQGILFKDGRMDGGADGRRLGVPVGF